MKLKGLKKIIAVMPNTKFLLMLSDASKDYRGSLTLSFSEFFECDIYDDCKVDYLSFTCWTSDRPQVIIYLIGKFEGDENE